MFILLKKVLLISGLLVFAAAIKAQLLGISQVNNFALMSPDSIQKVLTGLGWTKDNAQFVPDSNFVRRTWSITIKESAIKSYVLHYDFQNEPEENYVVYQFPDRPAYKKFKKDIQEQGYKQLNGGKSRKKGKSKAENIHKEKEDLFYNEKTKRLTVIKEVFFYGLFSFLVYSYLPNSAMAEHVMHPKPEEQPKN